MRPVFLAIIALILASPAAAAERPLLAVLDFSGKQAKLSAAEAQALTGIARKQALEVLGKRFALITRENLVDLLKSHGKTLEKCQGECETETGRLIGAEVVVSGRITNVFGAYRLEVKAHRTSPPELLAFEEATSKKRSSLPDIVKEAARALYEGVAKELFGNRETAESASTPGRSAKTAGGFVRIEPGTFTMGSPRSEEGRASDEGPRHRVTISQAFALQSTEVTQHQWKSLMGNNPSHFSSCGASCPVEKVSWWDALAYVNALSKKEGLEPCFVLSGCSGRPGDGSYKCAGVNVKALGGNPLRCVGYRLPTEAEWEYAARSGTEGARYGSLGEVAWYKGNSGGGTHPVGKRRDSPWGLHDMLGNVWEWTWDWFEPYGSGTVKDPADRYNGSYRVYRGGSWDYTARNTRAARRYGNRPEDRRPRLGFRPSRSLP